MYINRRDFLKYMSAGAAWTVLPAGCSKTSDEQQTKAVRKQLKNQMKIDNIIMISLDTTRADHIACYGHPFIKTPHIDNFAKESVLFKQHVVTSTATLPSHTSLMTGTYPHTHGVLRNGRVVNKKNIMLAETLKAAGFTTAAFIGAITLGQEFLFDQGFDKFDSQFKFIVHEKRINMYQSRAEHVTDATLNWLDKSMKKKANNNNSKKKYFLFCHYYDPHLPYDAPEPYKGMYRKNDSTFNHSMDVVEDNRAILRKDASPEALKLAKAYDSEYCAEITYCDHHLGRLMDSLKQRGLYDNSLIIITGDHGETINEHFCKLSHSMSVYETEILVPLIVRFPGGQFGGQRLSRLVSNIDVMPTILHLLGLEDNKNIEGQSFAGLVDGVLAPRDPVFSEATSPQWLPEYDDDPVWPNRKKFQCVRTERYKFVMRTTDNQYGLYDLKNDPNELDNLLLHKKKFDTKLVQSLKKQLDQWSSDVNLVGESKMTESEEAIKALESLGYVGN